MQLGNTQAKHRLLNTMLLQLLIKPRNAPREDKNMHGMTQKLLCLRVLHGNNGTSCKATSVHGSIPFDTSGQASPRTENQLSATQQLRSPKVSKPVLSLSKWARRDFCKRLDENKNLLESARLELSGRNDELIFPLFQRGAGGILNRRPIDKSPSIPLYERGTLKRPPNG